MAAIRPVSRWFSPETDPRLYVCPCGRPACDAPTAPHRLLLRYLDIIRDQFGQPLAVTSGNRCAVHNAAAAGEPVSEHVWPDGCLGCDIRPARAAGARLSSRDRFRLLDAVRLSGVTRVGIRYDQHVHIGVGNFVDEARFPAFVAW